MRKFILFLTVFFLALFVFNSPAYAYKSSPSIDYAYAEEGMLHIYGSNFSNQVRVELCGEVLALIGETTHDHIQVVIPEKFQNGGTCRLVLSKKIKRWGRWYFWTSTRMDITIAAWDQNNTKNNPNPQQPPVDVGDTTPPAILNPMGPTDDPGFLETYVLISFDVKDDTELAFIGIQNLTSGASRTVYLQPGIMDWPVSEEIATTPGDNTIMLLASDTRGNIVKDTTIRFRREINCAGCNLRGLDLSGDDFYGAKMPGADLTDTNLSGANLVEADLSGEAILTRTNLSNANLHNADMTFARFDSANLAGADLNGSKLVDVFWKNTICPDGTNSDDNGGTCLNNLTP